jgi:hypothetical protein
MEKPVPVFESVIVLLAPEHVNVTDELFVMVRLLRLGGLASTVMLEPVLITTSCAAVGTTPKDQLLPVFQELLPPVHVFVWLLAAENHSKAVNKKTNNFISTGLKYSCVFQILMISFLTYQQDVRLGIIQTSRGESKA